MNIILQDAQVISQAPADVRDWGPWQFPRFFDGGSKLCLEFHVSADSAKSYGNPRAWFVSEDRGETWTPAENGGLLLDNGDLVKPHQTRAIPEADVQLPEPLGQFTNYGFVRQYFDYGKLDAQYKHWYIERKRPGQDWEIEEVEVELPGYVMNTSEGVFPMNYFHHFKKGPDGAIWALPYKHFCSGDTISSHCASWFLKSVDDAKTFQFVSRIPYRYDLAQDPDAEARYGLTEPDICFLDDQCAFALHRTTDGTGVGPMYITWSDDGGFSWTDPGYFDDCGVWPQTVRLESGVVLAGYGRPGLYLRPYYDSQWHDRITVVEPMDRQTDTCSYCALTAIDENTALIAYSDFNCPGPDGTPRKSIMVRKVEVAYQGG